MDYFERIRRLHLRDFRELVKSSLLSIITNGELETGSISEKISRGKHTTRHVELLNLKAEVLYLIHPVSVHLKLKI